MTDTEARELWTTVGSVVGLLLWIWFMLWLIGTLKAIRVAVEAQAREASEGTKWLRQLVEGQPKATEAAATVEAEAPAPPPDGPVPRVRPHRDTRRVV